MKISNITENTHTFSVILFRMIWREMRCQLQYLMHFVQECRIPPQSRREHWADGRLSDNCWPANQLLGFPLHTQNVSPQSFSTIMPNLHATWLGSLFVLKQNKMSLFISYTDKNAWITLEWKINWETSWFSQSFSSGWNFLQ